MDHAAHPRRQTLRELVVRSDDHPAFLMPRTGMRISYRALQRALDDARAAIGAIGVGSGHRVALSFTNGPEGLISFFAVVACGAAAAPLNPAFSEPELRAELDDLRISHLLHDPASAPRVAAAIAGSGAHGFSVALQADKLQIEGAPASAQAHDAGPAADAESIALLLHTSGTTSKPKTVPIRQRNLVASTHVIAQTYNLGPDDVTFCVMPLFHVHGLVASVLATLSTGGTVVLPPRFSASTFWDDVRDFDVTWYTAVPTIHASVLTKAAELGAGPEHRLRFVRSCSSPLPVPTWRAYEAAIDVPFVEAYGMTEAAHQMSSNPLPPAERRAGTVGRATGVEIAILDDAWRLVPAGEHGEVALHGPSVVDGYLDNPEANAASFRDGWFRTGDVGTLSDDGYLTLVGRSKELINRAGEKISPYEIEAVLLAHPAIREAAAFPIPDEKYGEQVGVVVVVDDERSFDPDDLRQHCADRMAPFKVPARIAVLAEIPKGPTGKVQRRNLAALVDS